MAGLLHSSLKPSVSSSSTSSSQSSSRLFLLLTLLLLLLSLACFAFVLQWHFGLDDKITHWYVNHLESPEMATIQEKPSFCPSGSDSISYFRDWKFDYMSDLRPKICITTTTSAGLEQTLPWIYFHKVIGVSTFYLFVEGKAASPDVSRVLETIPGIKVIHRTKELEDQQAKSRIWNEYWLSTFFYRPCNYELFVKQSFNMETAIAMAQDDDMDWIVHLDTDELIHPSGTIEYSLRNLLGNISSDVDAVIFPNHESSVERDDIKEPFTEVSLFKTSYEHLPKEVFSESFKEVARGNPQYFLTYGNGKSAARVQDHLRPNGAHRWENYMKKIYNEITLEEAVVLHYSYTRFSDLTSRHDRCNCKPTKVDVERCFFMEFDRDAFIIASTANSEEMLQWYREHVVWTDEKLKLKLLRKGVLTRIYAPMVIIQGLREAGVFSSVVNTALSNNSSTTDSTLNMTQESSQETGRRRLLEFHLDDLDGESKALAVLPQSPPGFEAIHMELQSEI